MATAATPREARHAFDRSGSGRPISPGMTGRAMANVSPAKRRRPVGWIAVAVVWEGFALVVVDGSPWWATVREAAIMAVSGTAGLMLSRRGSGRRGAVAGGLGLVAAAVGAALVASYARTGLAVRTLAGALLVVGGIALAVQGLARFWRGRSRLAHAVLVPVAAALAFVAVFTVAMPVYATNVGRPSVAGTTPADRGFAYLDVSFRTGDGVWLSGWYIPSSNGAAVVALHGASSTRSAVLDEAVVLARHGYGVLLFDARGMGRSGGRAMDFGWYGERDLSAAIDYLATRVDVDPGRIGALGESMGGEEAIGTLGVDGRLRAVVAEGASNRVAGDWAWLSDEFGVRGVIQRGILWLTYHVTDLLTSASPPRTLRRSVAEAAPRPVLLIAAGKVPDEQRAGRFIRSASPASVDLWVIPGAVHTGGLAAQPTEWERHVIDFFDSALRG